MGLLTFTPLAVAALRLVGQARRRIPHGGATGFVHLRNRDFSFCGYFLHGLLQKNSLIAIDNFIIRSILFLIHYTESYVDAKFSAEKCFLKKGMQMKTSNLSTMLLAALLGISSGCAGICEAKAESVAPAKQTEKSPQTAPKKAAVKKAAPKKAAVTKAAPKTAKKKAAAPAKKRTLEQEIKRATTPLQYKRHIKRHAEKKAFAAANKDKIKILMIGDSITHQWEYPVCAAFHKKYIAPYSVLNVGCGGDRTYNTLWIIEKSGIMELIKPQLVTIMIGTNNRGPHQATAAGIKKIIDNIRQLYPEAKILLYAIFPRGKDNTNALRIANEKVNEEIVKFCDGKNVIWVDIRKEFLTPEGILERSMMPDLLHPRGGKGYDIWGKSLNHYFEKYGK